MTASPQPGAAIDVGSNSVHLLIAELVGQGIQTLVDESVQLGLGAIVDREGRLPGDAVESTVQALGAYVGRARAHGADRVTLLATEPLRRAANSAEVQASAERAIGLPLHVLSHEAEAELTLLGVTLGRPLEAPIMVIDIGGGSTEIILATPGGDPVVGALQTGSARLTAAIVEHDPPTMHELDALRAEATRLFAGMPEGRPQQAVVVGGTGTNLTKVLGQLRISRLEMAGISRSFAILAGIPAAELAARCVLNVRRALQLAAGAALLEAALARYGLPSVEVSDASLREGAVLAASIYGDAWPERLSSLVAGSAREPARPRGAGREAVGPPGAMP